MNDLREQIYAIACKHLTHIKREKAGQILASCPFHITDDPRGYSQTLSMSLDMGVFNCYSCRESGNLRKFLYLIGTSKAEVRSRYGELIDAANKNITVHADPDEVKNLAENQSVPEYLLGLFDYTPTYLKNLGFDPATLKHFEVGYDKFNDRVTYPLRDAYGTLVGISGRNTRPDSAEKYKLYGEELAAWGITPLPPKRDAILWNAHNVLRESKSVEFVLIVEGFKACMWCYQSGIDHVVAILGNKITDAQVQILEKVWAPKVLMLDGDKAGLGGALASGRKLSKSSKVLVAQLLDGDQPDDLDSEDLVELVQRAKPYGIFSAKYRRKE